MYYKNIAKVYINMKRILVLTHGELSKGFKSGGAAEVGRLADVIAVAVGRERLAGAGVHDGGVAEHDIDVVGGHHGVGNLLALAGVGEGAGIGAGNLDGRVDLLSGLGVVLELVLGGVKLDAADEADVVGLGEDARKCAGQKADLLRVGHEGLDVGVLDRVVQDAEVGVGIVLGHLLDGVGVLVTRGKDEVVALVDVVLHGGGPVGRGDGLGVGCVPTQRVGRVGHGLVAGGAPAAVVNGAVEEDGHLLLLLGSVGAVCGTGAGVGRAAPAAADEAEPQCCRAHSADELPSVEHGPSLL